MPARWIMGTSLLLAVAGCGDTAEAAPDDRLETAATAAADARPADPAGWRSVRSSGGTALRVRLEPDPPAAGHVRVFVEDDGDVSPRSIDVASPAMPMHGVTRYTLLPVGDFFAAMIEIPMAGQWSIWINLDEGGDAAEARFTVGGEPADHDSAHGH